MKSGVLLASLADAAMAPQSAEPQLLDVDGTVLVMLAIFGMVAWVLTKWLWKPYLRLQHERVARNEGYREEAVRLEAEADAQLGRVQDKLAEARRAGAIERAKARSLAQERESQLWAEAQQESQRLVTEARAQIEAVVQSERAHLPERALELGRRVSTKVIGRQVAS
jgi:F-type H+-transporting ATPase subunit b